MSPKVFGEEFFDLNVTLECLWQMWLKAKKQKDVRAAIEYGHKYEAVSMEMDKLLGFA